MPARPGSLTRPAPPSPTGPSRSAWRRRASVQGRLAIDLGTQPPRRPGRPPLTETREEIIQRLLDPELSVHEAAALLNVSKATLRRYTDSGKLACFRTAGGQRRFKLSTVLALLEAGPGAPPPR